MGIVGVMKKLALLSVACSLAMASASQTAVAAPPPPPVVPHVAHSVTGPWVVGGVAISALSLIVCGKVIGDKFRRQMTSAEAATFAVLPFGCLWAPPPR
jgi:H+/gluconate symporter-like permease